MEVRARSATARAWGMEAGWREVRAREEDMVREEADEAVEGVRSVARRLKRADAA